MYLPARLSLRILEVPLELGIIQARSKEEKLFTNCFHWDEIKRRLLNAAVTFAGRT
jgi:hypothetical protein